MRKRLLLFAALVLIIVCTKQFITGDNDSKADSLLPTYTNPVGGDLRMGDPFALRVKDRYYLYGSTATGKGFKGWTSADMVNWEPLSFVYQHTEGSWGGKRYWAPEAIEYQGKFYLVFSCQPKSIKKFAARICLAVSDKPEGPFADLHLPLFDNGWACIDGHIFVDDDGTPYLYFAKVGAVGRPRARPVSDRTGYLYGVIYGIKLKKDLSGTIGRPFLCNRVEQKWENPQSTDTRCNEGAFVLKHNGTYYMTYSANHYTHPFYGIGYSTAPAPLGPWTKSPANPLVQRDPAIGLSGPGHSSITTSPDGKELFIVYHAHSDPNSRPRGRTVNIDRLIFDDEGDLRLIGPTRTPQPMPSGVE